MLCQTYLWSEILLIPAHPRQLDRKRASAMNYERDWLIAVCSGMVQAEIVASNIQNILDNKPLYDYAFDPAGIHLTLGIVSTDFEAG